MVKYPSGESFDLRACESASLSVEMSLKESHVETRRLECERGREEASRMWSKSQA